MPAQKCAPLTNADAAAAHTGPRPKGVHTAPAAICRIEARIGILRAVWLVTLPAGSSAPSGCRQLPHASWDSRSTTVPTSLVMVAVRMPALHTTYTCIRRHLTASRRHTPPGAIWVPYRGQVYESAVKL